MPRIEMTPTVRIALFGLRVYLIVLLGLIALKFIREFSGAGERAAPRPTGTESREPKDKAQDPSSSLGWRKGPAGGRKAYNWRQDRALCRTASLSGHQASAVAGARRLWAAHSPPMRRFRDVP
jgi:hypothetical protein